MTKNTTEPGYKAVLVREETKLKLQALGRAASGLGNGWLSSACAARSTGWC